VTDIAIKVKCPVCSNKRLFDLVSATQAELIIKCPKCKKLIHLSLKDNKIKAKAM